MKRCTTRDRAFRIWKGSLGSYKKLVSGRILGAAPGPKGSGPGAVRSGRSGPTPARSRRRKAARRAEWRATVRPRRVVARPVVFLPEGGPFSEGGGGVVPRAPGFSVGAADVVVVAGAGGGGEGRVGGAVSRAPQPSPSVGGVRTRPGPSVPIISWSVLSDGFVDPTRLRLWS